MSEGPDVSPQRLRGRLRELFGFRAFRPEQLEAVRSAMEGRDVVAVMPTGSGKSLCFQLPALELEGTTVVVSPLIALMKDQADGLRARGIAAVVINSTLTAAQRRQVEEDISAGRAEFVYTTPEQVASPEFRDVLRRQAIDLFVVDEAHCVSQWGHDFRPEYLSLWEAVEALGRPPVLALTATATEDVLDDIRSRLRIADAELVHTGFFRPNIRLAVRPAAGDGRKREELLRALGRLGETGIVYAATVRETEDLADFLAGQGAGVAAYHGKMAARRRSEAQDRFMAGGVRAMVATNAFGLGIDKPDIRFVIHYHLPPTPEALYQEVGRAGRDGEPAEGLLLYDPEDQKLQRFFAGGRYPDDSDLVNAYHALGRVCGGGARPTLAELQAASPVKNARLRACLDVLAGRGVVRREARGRLALVAPDLTRDEVARAGQSFKERQERDREKLQRVVRYAEGSACRWQALLDYFGSDELSGPCGNCDVCVPSP